MNRVLELNVPSKFLVEREFRKLSDDPASIVLRASLLNYLLINDAVDLADIRGEKQGVFVVVDGGVTKQQFAQMVHLCYLQGVSGIVCSLEQRIHLDANISFLSKGALELMDIYAVEDTNALLLSAKNEYRIFSFNQSHLHSEGFRSKSFHTKGVNVIYLISN